MGGRGSSGSRSGGGGSTVTDGMYPTTKLFERYSSIEQLRNDGFVAMNDFTLSALLNERNTIGEDIQPWNSRNRYYKWDADFKDWTLIAERRYK